jgi:hypothetical protein
MKDPRLILSLLLIIVAVSFLPTVHIAVDAAQASGKSGDLQQGWNKIPGGPGTICSQGTPYSFFYRPGNTEKLLVHFQGGGACWMYSNCDLKQRPTYDPALDPKDDPQPTGIFDFANPANPFADFTVLFVPYCTADVHLGNRTVTYSAPASATQADNGAPASVQIHHKGYSNAQDALRWLYERVKAPRTVFVTGESAGAIASSFYADRLAEQYQKAQIIQLGDCAGGYRAAAVPKLLEGWGATAMMRGFPSYVQADPGKLNFETLYTAAARNHPAIKLAQFNTAEDETQVFFLSLVGVPNAVLPQLLEQNYADIRAVAPGFRTFTAPGKVHVILRRPEFYSVQANGVRLRDWVTNLLAGRPVENISPTNGK